MELDVLLVQNAELTWAAVYCGSTPTSSALTLSSSSPPPPQVSADFIKSGEFSLERMGVTYKAKAHLKAPFDPENKRVKGIYA